MSSGTFVNSRLVTPRKFPANAIPDAERKETNILLGEVPSAPIIAFADSCEDCDCLNFGLIFETSVSCTTLSMEVVVTSSSGEEKRQLFRGKSGEQSQAKVSPIIRRSRTITKRRRAFLEILAIIVPNIGGTLWNDDVVNGLVSIISLYTYSHSFSFCARSARRDNFLSFLHAIHVQPVLQQNHEKIAKIRMLTHISLPFQEHIATWERD